MDSNIPSTKLAMKHLIHQIIEFIVLVRSNLGRLACKKINTLITVDVRARDIARDSILVAREFQLVRTTGDASIRQCTSSFQTTYAPSLNGSLVITPLTDRCIGTLTQTLSICFDGSPAQLERPKLSRTLPMQYANSATSPGTARRPMLFKAFSRSRLDYIRSKT